MKFPQKIINRKNSKYVKGNNNKRRDEMKTNVSLIFSRRESTVNN